MTLACATLQRLWHWSLLPGAAAYQRALDDPMRVQQRLLENYLSQNACTDFGRRHGFEKITTIREFQKRVPLSTFDDYQPYIERIRAGQSHVLTREPVLRFVPSSGSTAACKLIPYTRTLGREFQRALAPWIAGLFKQWPDLRNGPAYWAISPAIHFDVGQPSAVPVGFEDDSAYLGPVAQQLVHNVLAVPSDVRQIEDIESFRYVTLLYLLRARGLRLVSVWHPSYFTLLLNAMEPWWDRLLDDITHGRLSAPGNLPRQIVEQMASLLRPMPARGRELRTLSSLERTPENCWPHLRVISCWAEGPAADAAAELAALLPGVQLQSKGLLATEGIVTLPLHEVCPLAVRSHFFEFIDAAGEARLAGDLEMGHEYAVVMTTGGGLYRYQLQDRIRVAGYLARTPVLQFLGKEDRQCDLAGEKLSEGFVSMVIEKLCGALALKLQFAMLAPDDDARGYTLYIQAQGPLPGTLENKLESLLQANPHYQHCVRLGQLKQVRCYCIADSGHEVYLRYYQSIGKGLGNIKPRSLCADSGWSGRFTGSYVCARLVS